MNKKIKKELTRLLSKKLDALGVSNDTKLREVGQKRGLALEDGKIVEKDYPINRLQNLKKQMILKILEGGENAARAFIAMDNQALKGSLNPEPPMESND